MLIPVEVAVLVFALAALVFGVVLQVKQIEVDHLREHIRLYMTNGGRQYVTAEEAAAWVAAGKLPTQVTAQFKLRGSDLVAAANIHNYRTLRTR